MSARTTGNEQSKEGFICELGLIAAAINVADSVIGSGIFIFSAKIARRIFPTGGLFLKRFTAAFPAIFAFLPVISLAFPNRRGSKPCKRITFSKVKPNLRFFRNTNIAIYPRAFMENGRRHRGIRRSLRLSSGLRRFHRLDFLYFKHQRTIYFTAEANAHRAFMHGFRLSAHSGGLSRFSDRASVFFIL
jgi:hypothetical protein